MEEKDRRMSELPTIDLDAEDINADWTKRTWDLPQPGTPEFENWMRENGLTLEDVKKLPAYRFAKPGTVNVDQKTEESE